MKHDQFVGEIVNRLSLPGRGEGLRAVRAVLQTLGERIQEGQATNLAGALPMEIDIYLTELPKEYAQSFDLQTFVERVAERMGANPEAEDDLSDAAFTINVVLDLANQAIPSGEVWEVRRSLPDEFDELFELMEAREQGKEINLGQGREQALQGARTDGGRQEEDVEGTSGSAQGRGQQQPRSGPGSGQEQEQSP